MNKPRFSPTLCVTHRCNLDCIYCYQNHDSNNVMSLQTATKCIDWIFENIPSNTEGVEIGFIGGEPLLEFELLKSVVEYTNRNYEGTNRIFYATTNGTVLTQEMKEWFTTHREEFVLGLSLDGLPETHNRNRSNSFDKIDLDFFKNNWPYQGIKMTLSEFSLEHLADNIIYLHSLGFGSIGGVNLFEGEFDWSKEKYIQTLIPQLEKLVSFYVENDTLALDQMMDRHLELLPNPERKRQKWCGIGTGTVFFDTDGSRFPCPFVTPMTFSKEELDNISLCDFTDESNFIDDDCFNTCYLYPVCPHCSAANYLNQKTFKVRDRSKCRIQKLITLYCADLQAKRILKNPDRYDDITRYNLIQAIRKIRELYLPEFGTYMSK